MLTEASASHTDPATENQGDARRHTEQLSWKPRRTCEQASASPPTRTFLEQAVAEEARPLQVTELPADPHVHPAEGVDVTVLLRRLLSFQLGEDTVKQALC